jgi:hypothetical protein
VNRERGQKQYGAKRKGSAFHLSKIVQTRAEGLSLIRTMTAPPAQMSEWQRFLFEYNQMS